MKPSSTKALLFAAFLFVLIAGQPLSSALASDALPPQTTALQSQPSATTVSTTNVRGGPGTDFFIMGTLSAGQTVPLAAIDSTGNWLYVSTAFGNGWITSALATASGQDSVPVKNIVSGVISVGVANIRSGAGLEAPRLGRVSLGQRFEVLGRNADGSWFEIRWQYGTGWVSATTLDLGGSATTANEVLAETSEMPYLVIMATYLNVRSGPGVNYSIVTVANGGDVFPILSQSANGYWFQVQTPAGSGWVSSEWVTTRNEYGAAPVMSAVEAHGELAGPIGIVNTGALNLRSGPGAEYTDIGTLSGGDQAQIVGRSQDWSWWLLATSSGSGWANAQFIIARGDTSKVPYVAQGASVDASLSQVAAQAPAAEVAGPVAFVATGALNVRSGPNATFDAIGSAYAGTRMAIVGQSADRGWWQVDSPFGRGWVTKLHTVPEGDTTSIPVTQ